MIILTLTEITFAEIKTFVVYTNSGNLILFDKHRNGDWKKSSSDCCERSQSIK